MFVTTLRQLFKQSGTVRRCLKLRLRARRLLYSPVRGDFTRPNQFPIKPRTLLRRRAL